MSWRDLLTIVGLIIGAVSLWWGFRQSAEANSAREAERKVRRELYQSKVVQRMSQLSAGLIRVRSLIRSGDYEYAAQAGWDLLSDLAHAAGYGKSEFTTEELKELDAMQTECSKILVMLPKSDAEELERADEEMIDRICLSSVMFSRRVQGRLEILQEHVSEPTSEHSNGKA